MAAYIVAMIDVHDPDLYAEYAAQVAPVLARHGGRYLVRGGAPVPLDGAPFKRVVVMEFATEDDAQAFWTGEAYAPIKAMRERAAHTDAAILPGYD